MPSHPGFDTSPRVAADAPYPPLEVNGPNHQIVRMLAFDLASDKSEMTSVTQYMYQGWALDRAFAGIARTLERLAQVEMRHMQILGKLIRMLGGDPRYAALRRGRRFTGMVEWFPTAVRQNPCCWTASIWRRRPSKPIAGKLPLFPTKGCRLRSNALFWTKRCMSAYLNSICVSFEIVGRGRPYFTRYLQIIQNRYAFSSNLHSSKREKNCLLLRWDAVY